MLNSSSLQGSYLRVHKYHISGTPCCFYIFSRLWSYPCELQGSGSLDSWHNSFAFRKFQLSWGNLAAPESSGLLLFLYVGATNIEELLWGGESSPEWGVSPEHGAELVMLQTPPALQSAWRSSSRVLLNHLQGSRPAAGWSPLARGKDPFLSQSGPTGSAAFDVVYL